MPLAMIIAAPFSPCPEPWPADPEAVTETDPTPSSP
jgi:hypothetical protein